MEKNCWLCYGCHGGCGLTSKCLGLVMAAAAAGPVAAPGGPAAAARRPPGADGRAGPEPGSGGARALEEIQQQGLLTARMAARPHDTVAFKRGGVVHSCCELRRRKVPRGALCEVREQEVHESA